MKNRINILLTTILLITLMMVGMNDAKAQEADLSRNIRVLYIDHEPSLQSSKLIKYIRQMRREQTEFGHALIIYVPNGETPYISLTGLEDPTGSGNDSPAAFDRLCEALNQPSHDKLPWFDRKMITEFMDIYNIVDKDNNLMFGNVRFEFYLTPEYWKLGYNESIIAPLFFALNVQELKKQNFNFDIYVDPENQPKYDKEHPFGLKNYNDVNTKLVIDEYTF